MEKNKRLNIYSSSEKTDIIIDHRGESWQKAVLAIWLVLWTSCGFIVVNELVTNPNKDTKVFFGAYMVFWFYFEYITFKILSWRWSGKELIRLQDDSIYIKNDVRGYGAQVRYFKNNIKKFDKLDLSSRLYKASSRTFWTKGAQALQFEYAGKKIGLGYQLTEAEADKLNSLIQKFIRKKA